MCIRDSDKDIEKALEDKGFHNIEWATEYSFKADENGKKCPCCGNVHTNNCWKVSQAEDTGSIFVKSFSDRCNSTLLIRGTKDQLPPFAFVLDENERRPGMPGSPCERPGRCHRVQDSDF